MSGSNPMRHLLLVLFASVFLAHGLAGPFRYCLEDGELCCSGWTQETCCEAEADPGTAPELVPGSACLDVEASLDGILSPAGSPLPARAWVSLPVHLAPDPPAVPLTAPAFLRAASPPPDLATAILRR
jgi:hypothetical protein